MIKTAMEKVVIVGAGMTGATLAAQVRRELKPISLKVLDKGRGAGGRMATSWNSQSGQSVDLGAQYFSITPEYADKHRCFHEELFSAGILRPFTGTIEGHREKDGSTEHYVTPNSSSSLVKHFLKQSEADVLFTEEISHVDVKDKVIHMTCKRSGSPSVECDALILTMPIPQVLALQGNIKHIIDSHPDIKKKLEGVSYSSRFCAGLFFTKQDKLPFNWDAKYYEGDPVIRFASIDPQKRGNVEEQKGLSMCIHATVPYSLRNLESSKEDVGTIIVQRLLEIEPGIPKPEKVKPHKWRFSQVHRGYPDSPGCIVLNEDPPIILAGDAFTRSTMDGCIESALTVKDTLLKLKGKL